jgi:hypothetical protein
VARDRRNYALEPPIKPGVKLIGQVRKNAETRLVVTLHRQRKIYAVDVREFVESDEFTGFTKRGIRLNTELIPELIDLLQDAWQAEGEEEPGTVAAPEVPPSFVLGMRAVGETVESIVGSIGASRAEVMTILKSRGGICPRCSSKVPTDGESAYICPNCSTKRSPHSRGASGKQPA